MHFRFEDKRGRSEVVVVKGDGSSRQQVLTLDKLLSRWGAPAGRGFLPKGSGGRPRTPAPAIQVEGRGRGMAVVQLRTSYYTTSLRRLSTQWADFEFGLAVLIIRLLRMTTRLELDVCPGRVLWGSWMLQEKKIEHV